MKPRVLLAGALAATVASSGLFAQDKPAGQKDKPKDKPPARSFTDEDLKKYKQTPGSSGSTSSENPPKAEVPGNESGESGDSRRATESETGQTDPSRSPEESSWRARAAEARRPLNEAKDRIAQTEAQIADLREQLNPMSTRYVLGGNSNAGPGKVLELEEQMRALDSELVAARNAVAEAEKGWARFLEEARSAGANPNWLNP